MSTIEIRWWLRMSDTGSLWRTDDGQRYFLLPVDFEPVPGSLRLFNLTGQPRLVNPESVACFEMAEDQAHRWARGDLAGTLEELRSGLDETIGEWRKQLEERERQPIILSTQVTQDSGAALLDLAKQLPRVLGQSLSGNEDFVRAARETMNRLQQRLRDSGIDVDDRVGNFADRIASIRDNKPEK